VWHVKEASLQEPKIAKHSFKFATLSPVMAKAAEKLRKKCLGGFKQNQQLYPPSISRFFSHL
jgi:CRISPR/Cas system endoribonuclease Cas6 (RAMP superfamily)